MEAFKTIAIFNYTHEIVVLKHRLDQEEVQYYFENETMSAIAPFYSNALGGIKLKVHPNDYELVTLILAEFGNNDKLTIV